MIKLISLIVGVAIFLAALTVYIVPQQGGLNSSTSIEAQSLQGVKNVYLEDLPIQETDLGRSGRSIFIAFTMLSHMLFANLHLGGAWIAVLVQLTFLRTRIPRYERLARSLTLFNVILFSFGATFAAAAMFFFIALYPTFAKIIFHLYWWPLFIESFFFAVIIIFLYTFWFSWGRINPKAHISLGFGYAIAVFIQTLSINSLASGMLSPGGNQIVWGDSGLLTQPLNVALSWWFNGTIWELQFHRLGGSFAFFGSMLAMLAMFHYMDRKDRASRVYWDWVGSYGLAWSLAGLVVQPMLGLVYMLAIQSSQGTAFIMIMHGPRAWEMLLMSGLLSAQFLSIMIYFADRRETILTQLETKRLSKLLKIFLVLGALSAIVLIQPSWLGAMNRGDPSAWLNPLGPMSYKYVGLFTLVIIGALLLMMDIFILGDVKNQDWGNLPKVSRWAAVSAGIFGMWTLITMGYVRESARAPWVVYNIIPVPGQTNYPAPIPMWQIFVVWAASLALAVASFWLVSKVTAEHPEKAEEV